MGISLLTRSALLVLFSAIVIQWVTSTESSEPGTKTDSSAYNRDGMGHVTDSLQQRSFASRPDRGNMSPEPEKPRRKSVPPELYCTGLGSELDRRRAPSDPDSVSMTSELNSELQSSIAPPALDRVDDTDKTSLDNRASSDVRRSKSLCSGTSGHGSVD